MRNREKENPWKKHTKITEYKNFIKNFFFVSKNKIGTNSSNFFFKKQKFMLAFGTFLLDEFS